jgi:hypothetical protein
MVLKINLNLQNICLPRLWNDFNLTTYNKETKQGDNKKQTKVNLSSHAVQL